MRTVLLFALPEEHTAFRKISGPWRFSHGTPFRSFRQAAPSGELVLIETGMGQQQLLQALPWLLKRCSPDLIISAGFAGSLSKNLVVGDVCLVETFVCHDEDEHVMPGLEAAGTDRQAAGLDTRDGAAGPKSSVAFHLEPEGDTLSRLRETCHGCRVHHSRLVTVNRPQSKATFAGTFADIASIMDMESYFAVRFCFERRIPFLSIRAVSDGLRDEIDFDLAAISDVRGRVSIPRVLLSVLRSPGLMRSYYYSWRRSRTAAQNLGKALTGLTALPSEELEALAKSLSYEAR